MAGKWNLPDVTELNLLPEDMIYIPGAGGPADTMILQQAGFINKLRGWLDAEVNQTVSTLAALKSTWGALGGSVRRLSVKVQGRKPFFDLSGLGLSIYNEVSNPDGSVFAPPAYLVGAADVTMVESTHLTAHTFGLVDVADYVVRQPFELNFGLPLWVTNLVGMGNEAIPVQCEEQVGLWHLQEQKTRMEVNTNFFPAGVAIATDPQAAYNSADIVAVWDPQVNRIHWERELYTVPPNRDEFPDQGYIHQVIEYSVPVVGSAFTFPIPQVGTLLRAIFILHDNEVGHCLVDWSAMPLATISMTYGASDTPINRRFWAFNHEYMEDYGRYPPDGVAVLDFYKAGRRAARLARDTDRIANMAFRGVTTGMATGTCRIILESLVPHAKA